MSAATVSVEGDVLTIDGQQYTVEPRPNGNPLLVKVAPPKAKLPTTAGSVIRVTGRPTGGITPYNKEVFVLLRNKAHQHTSLAWWRPASKTFLDQGHRWFDQLTIEVVFEALP